MLSSIPKATWEAGKKSTWETQDQKAQHEIVKYVSNDMIDLIGNEVTAQAMINKLDLIYKTKSVSSYLLSQRELINLKMGEKEDPAEFLVKFERLLVEMCSHVLM